MNDPAKFIASSFALAGFTVAIIAGFAVGNPAFTILSRALASMIVCQIIGMLVASIAMGVVERHLAEYRAAKPLPSLASGASEEIIEVSPIDEIDAPTSRAPAAGMP